MIEKIFCTVNEMEKYERVNKYINVMLDQSVCNIIKLYKLFDVLNINQILKLEHISTIIPDLDFINSLRNIISKYVNDNKPTDTYYQDKIQNLITEDKMRILSLVIN